MLLMLSLLLAAAPSGAGASQPQRERPAACAVVAIESDQAPRAVRRFRATRIHDLAFEARVLGQARREYSLQLRVYTPDGFLYQVLETRSAPLRGPGSRFEARLPVAGTSIMASGLYGRWTVVPHESGRREPCGRGRSFVIRP